MVKLRSFSMLCFLLVMTSVHAVSWTSKYNVLWNTQSEGSLQSMPCGGGNLGLNVWVENNELLVLIGSSDSWAELPDGNHLLAKVGRIRITSPDALFSSSFQQEYDLNTNSIRISGSNKKGGLVKLRIWVDVVDPVIHIEGESQEPIQLNASIEIGRGQGCYDANRVEWCYRNENPNCNTRERYIKNRKLESLAASIPDVLTNLTFGGRLSGAGFVAGDTLRNAEALVPYTAWSIRTEKPLREIDLRATIRIEQDQNVTVWKQAVRKLDEAKSKSKRADWNYLKEEWNRRWNSSYIRINPDKNEQDSAWKVGRNYQLFRAMLAANSRGKYPTLFNGGMFTCEDNPENRQWSWSEFMAQNQRLVYWNMLRSGDGDLLQVALNFYANRQPAASAWANHFWGVKGQLFAEDFNLFGLPCYDTTPQGHSSPDCLLYHYVSGMEFALMMLELHRYNGNDILPYLPSIEGILLAYDGFYRNKNREHTGQEFDQNGLYVIYPSNAAELFSGCKNDATTISGLMALSDGLLALEEGTLSVPQKEWILNFRNRLPLIPKRIMGGFTTISPAESWENERLASNMEIPQLYALFPFGYYGVGKPNLDIAINTWKHAVINPQYQKRNYCWYQGNIFTARLGLTEEAKAFALAKFLYPSYEQEATVEDTTVKEEWFDAHVAPQRTRFPAFWDTGSFCQTPDFDHGGSALVGLQEMLMQTELPAPDEFGGTYGRKIHLFPAWPPEWDVTFKLHAPYHTTVECVYKDGKIKRLVVTPKERLKDVVIHIDN